ncbi:unnamed protein product [Protopolystoma xenopodis]|uniref:Uncharacterized protein n=1 Tax=Protopolystoma xenopodis TaxID=117903 RepID=A0A448XLI1_9PLAT|nr:unnamed protein product [Protopolystoma xenopodis]
MITCKFLGQSLTPGEVDQSHEVQSRLRSSRIIASSASGACSLKLRPRIGVSASANVVAGVGISGRADCSTASEPGSGSSTGCWRRPAGSAEQPREVMLLQLASLFFTHCHSRLMEFGERQRANELLDAKSHTIVTGD